MIKFNQKAKLAVNRDSEEWKTVCQTNTLVSQKTPVLYSTSRGIHLRTYKGNIYKLEHSYEFQVCDLERWSQSSKNRDTIGINTSINHRSFLPPEQNGHNDYDFKNMRHFNHRHSSNSSKHKLHECGLI